MRKSFFIAVVITLFVILGGALFSSPFQALNAKWVDAYFRIRGPIKTQNNIVIAAIDEKSVNTLGRWPWPRSTMAKLAEKLSAYGVKAAGFDITFSEPSAEDAKLAEVLKQSDRFNLGYFFYTTPEEMQEARLTQKEADENDRSIFGSRLSASSRQTETSGHKVYGVQTNVPSISDGVAADRHGFFNIFPE
ncbi:MAG TPA: CHASE2 domain-containing protein, partial [Candidatus Norongarragalinales archaeon]|nr:CHASE2 domain-containing protein [Candidatus Norongarragalinales archaeon]